MADADNIVSILRVRLQSVPGLWAVAWQNQPTPYVPVTGTPYIEEEFVFGTAMDTAHGPTPAVRWRQTDESYHLMLCVPKNSGVGPARAMANAICSTFLASSMSLPSGASLIATTTYVQPARDYSSWLKIPVVISYTFTTNA